MRKRDKEIAAYFREALKEAMEAKGLKNYELADAVGIAHTNISNYLNGISLPSSSVAAELARALEMDLGDLLPSSVQGIPGRNGVKGNAYLVIGRVLLDELDVMLRELRQKWEKQGRAQAAVDSAVHQHRHRGRKRKSQGT